MKYSKTIKNCLVVIGLAVTAGLLGSMPTKALVDTPWGPERKTFTWEDPAPYATFNSITNNPQVGDERNFVRVREVADGNKFGDEVTVEPGKTYEVYIYYHNNADAHEVGKTAIGIADGAAVKSTFPAKINAGEKATVSATVFASDTDPLSVWDGAYMKANQEVYLRYIPGTAIIHNGGSLNGQQIGSDYLFADGALLGYNKFSGLLPGCNEYAGYVTYQLFADAPGFEITKSVVGDNSEINPGDVVTFKLRYENTGTTNQPNVVMKDTLPESMEYVKDSTKLYNNNNPDGVQVPDAVISSGGLNIGNYTGRTGWAELTYQVLVKTDTKCGSNLTNKATVLTGDGEKTTSVTLKLKDCTPPPEDCTTNPDLPECQDCSTNPDLPGCKEDCTTNPNLPECQRIPDTGPVEIILAIIIVLGLGGAGYYYYRTQKKVKSVENKVSGKPGKSDKKDATPENPVQIADKDQSPKPENKEPKADK